MNNKLDLDIHFMPGKGYMAISGSDKNLKAEGKSIAEAIDSILEMNRSEDTGVTEKG